MPLWDLVPELRQIAVEDFTPLLLTLYEKENMSAFPFFLYLYSEVYVNDCLICLDGTLFKVLNAAVDNGFICLLWRELNFCGENSVNLPDCN